MKKLFKSLLLLALVPTMVLATPTSVDRITDHIEPLIRTDYIKIPYVVASSTSATSTLANALAITAGQTNGSASEGSADGTLNIINTLSNALGLQVYTNQGATTDSPLVLFRSDNTAFDDGLLWLLQDGTGGNAYNIKAQGPAPQIEWVESDQASPAGKFEDGVNGDIRYIASRNSGDSGFENAFTFGRFANGGSFAQLGTGDSYFTGSLGVGSTTPSTKLVVSGTTTVQTLVSTSTATSTFGGGVDIATGCFAIAGTCVGGGGGSGTVDSGTAGQFGYYENNGTTISGTSSIFITPTANIGIGTATPNTASKLHIDAGNATGRIILDRDVNNPLILSFRTDNLPRWAFRVDTNETGSNVGSDLAIRAYDDAGTLLSTPFFINRSTGNIGIGTTTPTSALDVAGVLSINGYRFGYYPTGLSDNASTIGIGSGALSSHTTGVRNVAIGKDALATITTGYDNTAIGAEALNAAQTTSNSNVAIGRGAGDAITSGSTNTLIGTLGGKNITTGSNNIIIGYNTTAPTITASNQLNIGNTLYGNLSTGTIGVGTTTPGAKIHSLSTTEQLRLGYDASNSVQFTISSGGNLSLQTTAGATAGVYTLTPHGAGGAGTNRTISFGAAWNNAALWLYNNGAGSRYGWGMTANQMQFFSPSTTGDTVTFNKGGDLQLSNANEYFRFQQYAGATGAGMGMGSVAYAPVTPHRIDFQGVSATTGTAGVENILRFSRIQTGGVSYPEAFAIGIGRYSSSGLGPDTRIDFSLKSIAATNYTTDAGVMSLNSNKRVLIGMVGAAQAHLDVIGSSTIQLRSGYDASNYWTASTTSTGSTTFNAVGAGASFGFDDDVFVPDEVYGSGWNGSLEVPTKNALYDKIETSAVAYTPPYIGNSSAAPNSVANVGSANRAWYTAVNVSQSVTVTGMRIGVGTQSGNIDVGLYDSSGTKIASSGSVATPAANSKATVSFSASVAITPGIYYLAISADNTTATFSRSGTDSIMGLGYQDTAFPLPSSFSQTYAGIAGADRSFAILGVLSGGISN